MPKFWQPAGAGKRKNILAGVMAEISSNSYHWQSACMSVVPEDGNQPE